jgi:hypothetical protein
MSGISKKKVEAIKAISVSHEVLEHYGHDWVNSRTPDEWSTYEKQLYDMANDIENKVLRAVCEIIKKD